MNDNLENESQLNENKQVENENLSITDFSTDNNENINDNNDNNDNNENDEEKETKKNTLFWIIYIIVFIIILIIIILLMRGCNSVKSKKYKVVIEANDWVTNMWNKCVDPIYWYTTDGTGINGASIDIDNVLKECDNYYAEYNSHNKAVNALSDEYKNFKEYYGKIKEQIDIIYPQIKANKPVSKAGTDYDDNMEIFYEYQVKLYNEVKNKYSKA